jgi:hypothetical protein
MNNNPERSSSHLCSKYRNCNLDGNFKVCRSVNEDWTLLKNENMSIVEQILQFQRILMLASSG